MAEKTSLAAVFSQADTCVDRRLEALRNKTGIAEHDAEANTPLLSYLPAKGPAMNIAVTQKPASRELSHWDLRVELAAAFRLAVEFDWHEGVANHFSVATSDDGKRFLMNPKWRHFANIKASDLGEYDSTDGATMEREDAPDATAWCIHGAIHAEVPHARCILHLHTPYATALASLANPEILPIDQNTARFYKRIAIDLAFGGIADTWAEGQRLARALGNHTSLIMGNHGILVVGPSVGEAFDELYYLERACRTLILAYGSGQPLNVMSDELAERTAAGWQSYPGMFKVHFAQLMTTLDAKRSDYAS